MYFLVYMGWALGLWLWGISNALTARIRSSWRFVLLPCLVCMPPNTPSTSPPNGSPSNFADLFDNPPKNKDILNHEGLTVGMDTTSVLKALQNPARLKISQCMAQRHPEQLEGAGLLKSRHGPPPIGAPQKRFFLNKRIGKLRIYLDLIEDNGKVGK